MEINDVRHINKGVNRHELEQGKVYIDDDCCYVLRTDENSVVGLSDGTVYELEYTYNDSSKFIPVNVVLEIRS